MDKMRGRGWWAPRRVAMVGLIVAMAVVGLISATLPGPTANAGTTDRAAVERFNGGDLVDGLLFGLGPAAEAYPDLVLTPTPVPDITENTRMLEQMYIEIQRQHPGALDRFATAIHSGDRVRINDVTLETIGFLQDVLPIPTDGSDTGLYVADHVDKLHVVLVFPCIILLCGVVLDLQVPFWHADSFVGTPSVRFEQWVDKVASTVVSQRG